MNGVWLDLLWTVTLRIVLLTAPLPALLWAVGCDEPALVLLIGSGVLVLALCAGCPWFFRLLWRTRDWWRVRRGQVVVYHPPGFANAAGVRAILDCCDTQVNSLERRFGFRLRGRVAVLLFKTAREVEEIFRDPCGGRALPFANAILINRQYDPAELARHELVHLYSAQWDVSAPPLLEEGLATWLQGSWWGVPVGREGRRLANELNVPLKDLLDRSFFFAPTNRYACYMVAASFTEFLIRHYGWDVYRKVFKGARRHGTNSMLKKHVGRGLGELEQLWRDELRVSRGRYVGGRLSEL